jgi:hypothetical protein
MALFGKTCTKLPFVDLTTLYAYLVLCVGCYASYLGATLPIVLPIALLLMLPHIIRARGPSPIEVGAHVIVALIFAAVAHIVGRGIAGAIGS